MACRFSVKNAEHSSARIFSGADPGGRCDQSLVARNAPWRCRAWLAAAGLPGLASAQQPAAAPALTLFQNVRIFDGKSAALSPPSNVLVKGNVIESISTAPIVADPAATVIAGAGRTLMPGLIDAHVHMGMSTVPLLLLMTADSNYTMLRQGKSAGEMLMRGFTSGRDVRGNTFGLKRSIDEGHLVGPRIWPSGATISRTSGHGDFRQIHDLPRASGDQLHFSERLGMTGVADGTDEVLRRVREQLMRGASHIKLMAGEIVGFRSARRLAVYRDRGSARRSKRRKGLGGIASPSTPIPPRASRRRSAPASNASSTAIWRTRQRPG